ncbi:hypothetical protein HYPSUDRAFT_214376 [Hypholoma sublateritium FD-334 SS-4]|uniref:Uncharacterized protein n=1 Tax=Hypholoma sublateritium (strain FD-334 SS-4) TaxID=945553 RepID=A0A0D2PZP7_HYPSF|nr:hypothetical protein HYPSUDRAFT_214376 [Hypholoma sublateritium FD-334 SS-4]
MSSEYRVLNFIQMPVHKGAVTAEVFSNGSECCYRIETLSDAINVYHNGSIAGRRPVATFRNHAGAEGNEMLTVAFHDEEPMLVELFLTTHSSLRKVLHNGSAHYEWVVDTDARRSWYEIKNPLAPRLPFARLRVGMGLISLELSDDICLRSYMCDGIVASVVLMCLTRDTWLQGAMLRLQ